MKKRCLAAALLACGFSVANAATPWNGPYASLFGGYAYFPNNISTAQFTNAHYKSGYNVGASIGYKSGPFNYDVQATYLDADIKRFNFNGTPQTAVGGETYAMALLANAYYSFEDFNSVLLPYVGFGLGYTYRNTNISSTTPTVSRLKDSEYLFSYQGTIGISYNFSEQFAADMNYRYFRTQKGDDFGKALQNHLANLAIIYRFDS